MKDLSKALLELADHLQDLEASDESIKPSIYDLLLSTAPEYAYAFMRKRHDLDVRREAARANDSTIFQHPHLEWASCREDFQDFLRAVAKKPRKKGKSPARLPAWKKLIIKRSKSGDDFAFLEGRRIRLRGKNAAPFLEHLKRAEGASLKAASLEATLHERPARICHNLPESLQRIIDKPGRGRVGYAMR